MSSFESLVSVSVDRHMGFERSTGAEETHELCPMKLSVVTAGYWD